MATLFVQDVPDELYARLQRQAKLHRRSVEVEVSVLLEWSTARIDRTSAMVLLSILCRRFFDPTSVGAPDSTTLLRQA